MNNQRNERRRSEEKRMEKLRGITLCVCVRVWLVGWSGQVRRACRVLCVSAEECSTRSYHVKFPYHIIFSDYGLLMNFAIWMIVDIVEYSVDAFIDHVESDTTKDVSTHYERRAACAVRCWCSIRADLWVHGSSCLSVFWSGTAYIIAYDSYQRKVWGPKGGLCSRSDMCRALNAAMGTQGTIM